MIKYDSDIELDIDNKVKKIEKALDQVQVDISDLVEFKEEMDMVINGGGFKGYCAGGILLVLEKYNLMKNIKSIRGVSAGAQMSCLNLVKDKVREGLRLYYYGRTLKNNVTNIINIFDLNYDIFPDNIHEIANKQNISFISTEIRWFSIRKTTLSNFRSKSNLIQCLKASCSIPFLFNNKWPFCVNIDNNYYIDGAFSDINGLNYYTNRKQLLINLANIRYPLYKAINPNIIDDNLEEIIIKGIKIAENFFKKKDFYSSYYPICIVKPNIYSKYYIFSVCYFLYRNFVSEISIYFKFFKRQINRFLFKY